MRLSETTSDGEWLNKDDLPTGSDPTEGFLGLTIATAAVGQFPDGKMSLDLTFIDHEKTFGCNPTNRRRLSEMTEDSHIEGLIGWRIKIGKEWTTDLTGKAIIGCRIQAAMPRRREGGPPAVPSSQPPPPQQEPPPPMDDDEIPF